MLEVARTPFLRGLGSSNSEERVIGTKSLEGEEGLEGGKAIPHASLSTLSNVSNPGVGSHLPPSQLGGSRGLMPDITREKTTQFEFKCDGKAKRWLGRWKKKRKRD